MTSARWKMSLRVVLAFLLVASAAGMAYAQSSCTRGDRWSLAQARQSLAHASSLARQLGNADCTGANYTHCQRIMAALTEAQDHIYQVFDQNYDSAARCRNCGFDNVVASAAILEEWESWLVARYFRSAAGVGNIRFTISQYVGVPLCTQPGTGAKPGPGMDAGIDRPGGDYRSLDVANDPATCKRACESEAGCRAWTFVMPGVQGPSARCWLKNVVPAPVASTCCTSGVVQSVSASNQCPVTFSRTFSVQTGTSIPGSNRVGGVLTTPEECARKCLLSDWCVSFEVDRKFGSCNYQDVHPCNTATATNPDVDLYSRNGLN